MTDRTDGTGLVGREPGALKETSKTARPEYRRWNFPGKRAGFALACTICIVSVGACARRPMDTPRGPVPIEWSGSDVAVVLERVVDAESVSRKGSKVVRWVTGEGRDSSFLVRPHGVAWDGDSLVVTDPGAGRVVRIDPRGRVRTSPEGLFETPIGVAVCSSSIVVTDSEGGFVAILDGEMKSATHVLTNLDRPTGIVCDDGHLFVVETGGHRVVVLNRETENWRSAEPGLPSVTWGSRGENSGEFNFPAAIAMGRGGLWVGDTLNFRVQELDLLTGRARRTFGELGDAPGEMPRLKGLAIDRDDLLWVSDAHIDRVAIYRTDGTFLMYFGGTGSNPGEFSFPAGIAVHPDGRVAIVDSLNRRLQVFRVTTPGGDG